MEKERKIKTLSVVALIVAVLGLTVAFAALSQTLTINGTASVDAASWDIHFANLSTGQTTGAATVKTEAQISGEKNTTIGDYDVIITKPGDSITYTFDVVNAGTVDANLGELTKNVKPTCTSNSGVSADETIVCDGLTYSLTYTDSGNEVKQNDTLDKGTTKNMTLTLDYDSDSVPSDDVAISGLGITLKYTQR